MTDQAAAGGPTIEAREVRLLEGPNLYFTRPALKVVLGMPGPLAAAPGEVSAVAGALGMTRFAAAPAGGTARQRALARLVERFVRRLAAAAGVRRVGVRTRSGTTADEVVVAVVWRRRGPAQAFGEALAPALCRLFAGEDAASVLDATARRITQAEVGEPPRLLDPRVPVVAVTGTNGKTTTTRLLAHIGMTAGRRTAWSSTDGVLAQGELVEAGDYSGPAGARAVLETPGVELGILETARGGMLLKGVGVTHNDVSVVTNVSADHLGQQGIDTVDQLAEVKAIITRITRSTGWCVLNGDDPRVWAMRTGTPARPWVFTLDPDSPAIREALGAGGRAITLVDGWLTVLDQSGGTDRLIPLADLPMAFGGLAVHNVANALAGAAAALAIGLPRADVVEGLATFAPDERLNAGRLNSYTIPVPDGQATVIIDLAHNEAGLEALLEVSRGLALPGARVRLALGTAGDRTDDILTALGRIAGLGADQVVLAHKERYLRGRSTEEMETPMRAGLTEVGVGHVDSAPTELAGLELLHSAAHDGDVLAVMCHADRVGLAEWIRAQGGRADEGADIRAKVRRARGEHPAQARIDALWEIDDDRERIVAARALVAEHPGDPVVLFELGGAHDAAGEEETAVGHYEAAIAGGLREPLRHRCLVQLASSLRNLGRHDEALTRIEEASEADPTSIGTQMFRALIRHDAGDPTTALADLLTVLAEESSDADVAGYRRSLTAYARELSARAKPDPATPA
ncbi:MAG: tetratricopeptide repeat protein [Actinobacteria bacterium]|nr:tetratricopeptide repeat protein [Actinomycetota bacterium]